LPCREQGTVNVKARTVFRIITFLAFCIASFAQDVSYYKAIQKGSSIKVQPSQFKKMEECPEGLFSAGIIRIYQWQALQK